MPDASSSRSRTSSTSRPTARLDAYVRTGEERGSPPRLQVFDPQEVVGGSLGLDARRLSAAADLRSPKDHRQPHRRDVDGHNPSCPRVCRHIDPRVLAAASINSVTFAFSEVMGRSYGGGVLELEPREAEPLPFPSPDLVFFQRTSVVSKSSRRPGAWRKLSITSIACCSSTASEWSRPSWHVSEIFGCGCERGGLLEGGSYPACPGRNSPWLPNSRAHALAFRRCSPSVAPYRSGGRSAQGARTREPRGEAARPAARHGYRGTPRALARAAGSSTRGRRRCHRPVCRPSPLCSYVPERLQHQPDRLRVLRSEVLRQPLVEQAKGALNHVPLRSV